jgi:hypothetical protein
MGEWWRGNAEEGFDPASILIGHSIEKFRL